jgi:very-short-patch-repair endonuclease
MSDETDGVRRTPQPNRGSGARCPDSGRGATHPVRVLGVGHLVTVSGRVDDRIAQIAVHQRGRVARWQLLAAAVSNGAIGRRVARGLLIPHLRGVFCVGHAAAIELGNETAALLALDQDAVVSHLSAACLWGLVTQPGELVDVTQRRHGPQLAGVCVHRSDTLTPKDVRIRQGLPVTSPARALLDSAPLLSDRQFELAFDRAMVDGRMRRSEVIELLARANGHQGAALLAKQLDREHGTTLTRSQAEERALHLIREAGLPSPQVNVQIHGYELDFYWPDHHLVLEIDGYAYHHTRRRFEHDHRKDATLRDRGEDVTRVTAGQVNDQPFAFVATITRALTRAQRD